MAAAIKDGPVPPIAGPGTETSTPTGRAWCGYCGFTGLMAGPRQLSCPERNGWHRYLARWAELDLSLREWPRAESSAEATA
jgi:hypothetical protein